MSLLLVAPQYLQQLKQKLCALQSAPVGSRSVLQQHCLPLMLRCPVTSSDA